MHRSHFCFTNFEADLCIRFGLPGFHIGGALAGIAIGLVARGAGKLSAYQHDKIRFMVCPSCGVRRRRRHAGAWHCKRCQARFCLDEEGNISVIESGEAPRFVKWAVTGLFLMIAGTGITYLVQAVTASWQTSPFSNAYTQRNWFPSVITGLTVVALASLTTALWIEFKKPRSAILTPTMKWSCAFVFGASMSGLTGILMGDPIYVLWFGGATLLVMVALMLLSEAMSSDEE